MATIEEQAGPPKTELARGALSLFDTISSTLANLAPVEGIFRARIHHGGEHVDRGAG